MSALRILGIVSGVCLLSGATVSSQATAPAPAPTIVLLADDERELVHDRADPLLLFVNVTNLDAPEVQSENRRRAAFVEAALRSDRFQKLAPARRQRLLDEHRSQELPVFTIGSDSRSLVSLLAFSVEDLDGRPVSVAVRALADAATAPSVATLDGDQIVLLRFGIDAEQFAHLQDGTYFVRASIDTRGAPGMWQGRAASRTLKISLTGTAAGSAALPAIERLTRVADYYLLDHQFVRAEAVARQILGRDGRLVTGFTLLGDALDGQKRRKEALDAFWQALDLFNAAAAEKGEAAEPPAYITQRIGQIQAIMSGG